MSILQAKNLKKEFNNNVIFDHLDLKIEKNEKIGIVGPNGVGKSTLIKMLAGLMPLDGGEIVTQSNANIAYLAQDALLTSHSTVYEEMKSAFAATLNLKKRAEKLEIEISKLAPGDEQINTKLAQYDELMQRFEEQEGYAIDAKIRKILTGFNFFEERFNEPVPNLSGGEKSRLALAKNLLTQPDLLFLDEPTNHLDLNTLIWLEDYLKSYHNALVIVSHDQYFLDRVTSRTLAFHHGTFKSYSGNYSFYLTESKKLDAEEIKHYEEQQKEREKLATFVEKNITRASTTKRAQSRRKQLEKMEVLERPDSTEKTIKLNFLAKKRSGNLVLTTNELAVGYDQEALVKNINLDVKIGEKIAVIGPNGRGKSTFVKTLVGQIPAISGGFQLGSNVEAGYYDQGFKQLDPNKTVIDQFWDEFPLMEKGDVLSRLAAVLFTGDEVNLKVETLSGGQKARLALLILMQQENNFLILDEPTNHLDIDSKEVLEKSLAKYEGTILFVSHDRYFINELADKTIDLTPNGAVTYLGDWDYYYEKNQGKSVKSSTEKNETKKSKVDQTSQPQLSFEEQKQLRKLTKEQANYEEIINKNEAFLAELQEEAAKPENGYDLEKLNDLTNQIEKTEALLDEAMTAWSEKGEEIEQFKSRKS
ncbi:ABC-F family ATP-binding cassette domain-containing protein [Xylocopilactobacillus apicola]|uniref:Multidrug ABC transporter ATP-binding protein n=1 Tax=Xylocopilactobacillus apicola TaxID=2932184 RepID=A0AAU9DB22_9LACO|nr:ABC-F family ATP-binding cassette domain-containing protein [Xylocopilactobacillus apicola]BDR58765.1 multidrug ABC transporter ATP-binding protein [Xylocopilactobacillus apicola]